MRAYRWLEFGFVVASLVTPLPTLLAARAEGATVDTEAAACPRGRSIPASATIMLGFTQPMIGIEEVRNHRARLIVPVVRRSAWGVVFASAGHSTATTASGISFLLSPR
jgi:hypothetical protein